ncbi:serine protease [Vibrio natriegens]|uniref:S1 family peptidase n=1 Tax=Vibrio natriegens TaxID=691 RepID=UPI002284BE3F|nr:serine protease [Vibrio natriegens]EIT7132644.1 trypsin-like peptidase domain-containing protein [Vibrio parahaemolyticus]EIV8627994.1 trypsin-like peptidase domain-containing protein [Vibrio parahaemolyticus]MCY9876616.1 serine protease [Vibrio natriegens]
MQKLYHECRSSIAYVTVETNEGLESIGTAFHIGQGYFVTAKHVVDNNKIIEVAVTQPHKNIMDHHDTPLSEDERPRILKVNSDPVLAESEVDDVAVFRVEQYEKLPSIKLSSIHDMHQSEDSALLSNVLCIGYPSIPLTIHPFQVAVDATVSALINIRGSKYLSYVVSATARGGFSGGPIINDEGQAIGLVTDSLVRDSNAVETGFMACLSISAAAELALKCGWDPDESEYNKDIESLASIKLALTSTARLNPHAHDLKMYVYDDGRDVFVEVSCFNEQDRNLAESVFSSLCPLKIHKTENYTLLATPVDNPSPILLKQASKAARDALFTSGYSLVRERFTDGWGCWD